MLDAHRDGRHRSKHLPQPQHHDDEEEEDEDMSISNRILKKLRGKAGKGKKNTRVELNMCEKELDAHKEELDTCNAELAAYIAKDNSPEYLYGQQADECKIIRREDGRMFMESSMFLEQTEEFSDRPFQYEYTIPTSSWFSSRFNNMFEDSKDGWPNAAISLVDDDESKGIVVSALVNGYVINQGDTAIYGYELDQSDDQASVMSLEELLGDKDERIFDHCSFFIDDFSDCVAGNLDSSDPYFDTTTYALWTDLSLSGTDEYNGNPYKVCWKDTVTGNYCWTKAWWSSEQGMWSPCAPNGAVTTTVCGCKYTIDGPSDGTSSGWYPVSKANAQGCANSAYWNAEDTYGACQGLWNAGQADFRNDNKQISLG